MANTVEIVSKAVNKASGELKKAQTDLVGLDKAGKSASTGLLGLGKSALTAVGGVTAVMGAVTATALAAKAAADDWQAYAFEVEQFARVIGGTPEEASKLIQVADDVRISTEQMTASLSFATRQGINPTVDGLGRMSDQYKAIQDPIERSRFLMENFGSGRNMANLMDLGSAKIAEMGDSIEGTSRLMTDEGIASAKAYYAAMDTLNDSVTDVKYSLGSELAPVLTHVLDSINENVRANLEYFKVQELVKRSVVAQVYAEQSRAAALQESGDWIQQNTEYQEQRYQIYMLLR